MGHQRHYSQIQESILAKGTNYFRGEQEFPLAERTLYVETRRVNSKTHPAKQTQFPYGSSDMKSQHILSVTLKQCKVLLKLKEVCMIKKSKCNETLIPFLLLFKELQEVI